MRRIGVDQQVVLVRRGACSRVWIGQGGVRGEKVDNGGPAGPGCWRQHTCPRFQAASKITGTITAVLGQSSARADARGPCVPTTGGPQLRSEEPTSELQSLMRISYAVFCLTKTNKTKNTHKKND